jgi:hypothetical protein
MSGPRSTPERLAGNGLKRTIGMRTESQTNETRNDRDTRALRWPDSDGGRQRLEESRQPNRSNHRNDWQRHVSALGRCRSAAGRSVDLAGLPILSMSVTDMRINGSIPTTTIGLAGGAAVGFLSPSQNVPILVALTTASLGSLVGVLGVHMYVFLVERVFGPRLTGRQGLGIAVIACTAGALPSYWLSNGKAIATMIGAATFLVPVIIWLARVERLTGTSTHALTAGFAAARVLLPASFAGAIGVPAGLIAWVAPILLAKNYNLHSLGMYTLWFGVVLGCATAATIGVAIGCLSSRILSRFSSKLGERRRSSGLVRWIVWSTVIGILVQGAVLFYLWIDPPNNIQGPGPFIPPFAVAAFAAVVLVHRYWEPSDGRSE